MQCPCHSEKEYSSCCEPLHNGKAAKSGEELMRSRFCAYSLGLLDYLMDTTHPANIQYRLDRFNWRRNKKKFSEENKFVDLKIHEAIQMGPLFLVSFTATLEQGDQTFSFTEESLFQEHHGRLCYLSGKMLEGFTKRERHPILPLTYFGDPILQTKANPIEEINDEIIQLAHSMVETMEHYEGVGIAAPQVGQSYRLFVIRHLGEEEKEEREVGEIELFFNPQIKEYSPGEWLAPEGCLSIPLFREEVQRPQSIEITYQSLDGKTHQKRFKGWTARVIQHEYDHIEGILYPDRLPNERLKQLQPHLDALQERLS